MTAEEIMTTDVTTVDETAPIADALELLTELDIRHLPVVRGKEVVGMLSDRDFLSLGLSLVTDIQSLDKLKGRLTPSVATLMNGNIVTVDPSAEIGDLIDLMLETKVGAVPVVEEDTNDLLGIVSYVDVMRAAREEL